MPNDIIICIEGLWKQYGLPVPDIVRRGLRRFGLAPRQLPLATGRRRRRLTWAWQEDNWVLRGIDLEVRRGETLGIVGPNGAAKSTLLKILAGVTPPTRGHIEVRGRVFPMIEINAGIHPELTGRENARLLGMIMGLSGREIDAKMPEIEEFTELEDWFDQPVRMYSSGMLSRLGFGVAVNIDSDILLIDETLSVGDLKFQNKSLARMQRLREKGVTILLVSHSLDDVQFIADRAIVLDKGRIVAEGSSFEALSSYEALVFHDEQMSRSTRVQRQQLAEGVTIEASCICGPEGQSTTTVEVGSAFGIEIEFTLHRKLQRPIFAIEIRNAAGILCVNNVSEEAGIVCPGADGQLRLRARYPENKLMQGSYEVNFSIREGTSYELIEHVTNVVSFIVVGSGRARGIVAMFPQWQVESRREVSLDWPVQSL